jgi:hypothetical protein
LLVMVVPKVPVDTPAPVNRLKVMVEVSRLVMSAPLESLAVSVTVCEVPDAIVGLATLTVDCDPSKVEPWVTVTVGRGEVTAVATTLALTVAAVPGVPPVNCTE